MNFLTRFFRSLFDRRKNPPGDPEIGRRMADVHEMRRHAQRDQAFTHMGTQTGRVHANPPRGDVIHPSFSDPQAKRADLATGQRQTVDVFDTRSTAQRQADEARVSAGMKQADATRESIRQDDARRAAQNEEDRQRRNRDNDLTNPLNMNSPLSPLNPIHSAYVGSSASSSRSDDCGSSSSSYSSGSSSSSSSYDSGSSSSSSDSGSSSSSSSCD